MSEGTTIELSKNAQKIMDLVKDLTAVELNNLVKALEEEFGNEIPEDDAEKLQTVGSVIEYVEKNLSS